MKKKAQVSASTMIGMILYIFTVAMCLFSFVYLTKDNVPGVLIPKINGISLEKEILFHRIINSPTCFNSDIESNINNNRFTQSTFRYCYDTGASKDTQKKTIPIPLKVTIETQGEKPIILTSQNWDPRIIQTNKYIYQKKTIKNKKLADSKITIEERT